MQFLNCNRFKFYFKKKIKAKKVNLLVQQ